MREYCIKYLFLCCFLWLAGSVFAQERFPDGTPIPDWFADSRVVPVEELGRIYRITDYGVLNDSTLLQTEQIQAVIDKAAQEGGGVICITRYVFIRFTFFQTSHPPLSGKRSCVERE